MSAPCVLSSSYLEQEDMFQVLSYADVRDEMNRVNPQLVAVIDEIDPGPEYRLYKTMYPYGEDVVRDGVFRYINNRGENVCLTSTCSKRRAFEDLCYNLGSNPFSMILDNCVEVFMELGGRSIPIAVAQPGSLLSIWKVLASNNQQPAFKWRISSGARSVFMLPKISDKVSHARLTKAIGVRLDKPSEFSDHWSIFRAISANSTFAAPWHSKMLSFSKQWFDRMQDPAWAKLHHYVLNYAWQGSEFFRNSYLWNIIFSVIMQESGIQSSPYILDTIKHVFGIALGGVPGFVPLTDDRLGPFTAIERFYAEHYRLRDVAPILMGPTHFNYADDDAVYYSFKFPTTTVLSPGSRVRVNNIDALDEFEYILGRYLTEIKSGRYNLAGSAMQEVAENIQFRMIHPSKMSGSNAVLCDDIPCYDTRFSEVMSRYSGNSLFPNSGFWNGCVAMQRNEDG